jgi:hypothetical protein
MLRERRHESISSRGPSAADGWNRLGPLGRDITLVLLVKAILLFLLWWAFFRDPAVPHAAMDPQLAAQHLLAPNPAAQITHADR